MFKLNILLQYVQSLYFIIIKFKVTHPFKRSVESVPAEVNGEREVDLFRSGDRSQHVHTVPSTAVLGYLTYRQTDRHIRYTAIPRKKNQIMRLTLDMSLQSSDILFINFAQCRFCL